ncbi:type II toxin-antitoxin system HipA family toxin (plasmid) [Photobacterium sp. GJ3]|uniref:type II toxin-antitoxin system HipA family toxin n=1 Tax=Photobacterium sp. GJ3 TaxID=2829502 RepID=UPI001B8D4551|nr:type II toxin-antitoxin system HipA family toxin [Photobacterium sp. GJ3]QUJ69267.1 type II toxin-antitoxin system HipA family toxin [Photobacterium sp. GJ3]
MVRQLRVLMNGLNVGVFTKEVTGAHTFQYDEAWIHSKKRRAISLSLPLRKARFTGDEVINFFDNLLPDNPQVRERIVARYDAKTKQPFDLLEKIGRDSVGAITLIPEGQPIPDFKKISATELTAARLEHVLNAYTDNIPLGMVDGNDDFRISIAGAQEKTALLKRHDRWYIPNGLTPTTHIIKLPIGEIRTQSSVLDLTTSVDNELICMRLSRAFGLPTASCDVLHAGKVRALAVERFDRRYAQKEDWIVRLPQEDFCQVSGISPAKKYEVDGGIGIEGIMNHLLGSEIAGEDRRTFMKAQVLFFVLAAIDGHAKNFSLFLQPNGKYRLTPLYDIISAYPMMGGKGIHERKIKLAMGLKASTGYKRHWYQIQARHFMNTARLVKYSSESMREILEEFQGSYMSAVDQVGNQLPQDIDENVRDKIFEGIVKSMRRLTLNPA